MIQMKSIRLQIDLPLLHRRQLYPTVESGIIAADKISAVFSCKTDRQQDQLYRVLKCTEEF